MFVRANGGPDATSRVGSISITGGARLDLADNDLVVDYAPGLSPMTTVRNLIRGGSIRAATSTSPGFGLGYAEASNVLTSFPATFSGQTVDDSAVLVMFTRLGDANLDGLVSLPDFNRLASNFGMSNRSWWQGDFNHDGTVNLSDFNLLAGQFGMSAGADGAVGPEDWSALASAVPEPATVVYGGLVAALLMRRARPRLGR